MEKIDYNHFNSMMTNALSDAKAHFETDCNQDLEIFNKITESYSVNQGN